MSEAYEIYKVSVGGITMNGDKMKNLDELPILIQTAWKNIDSHYEYKIKQLEEKLGGKNKMT
jgi:hypothetical protein